VAAGAAEKSEAPDADEPPPKKDDKAEPTNHDGKFSKQHISVGVVFPTRGC
jgi:hypothetical protein